MDGGEYRDIVQMVIHCDYHPGNLKFQDSQITGLFDFDWSKIDVRCFDVGLALMYFCTPWRGEEDGHFRLDETAVFLNAYQAALRDTEGAGPLTDAELKYLPHMISAGNMYVLRWAIEDFYSKEVEPDEYLVYLKHNVHLMQWLENTDNCAKLEKIAAGAVHLD
jgi:homoserine kinase type II